MRQTLNPGRMTLVSLACVAMLTACGGGDGEQGTLQVINFKYPGGVHMLSGPTKLVATASSGLPVTFASTTPATCTVSGDLVSPVSAGQCRVVAAQAGGTVDGVKWAGADDTSQLFNVLKTPQLVAYLAPPPDFALPGEEVTLPAVATSGLPVTFSVAPASVCSINGTTIKLLGKGSCAVTATQAGTDIYAAAKVEAFIAVDPLVVANGILGAGVGSTRSILTKQGGAVTVNAYSSMIDGWEWCDNNERHKTGCFRTVSDDETVFTSALHVQETELQGWHHDAHIIEIFGPGLTDFNQSGDTTGGLQVVTETTFAMTFGVNPGLFEAKKPVRLHLDLGKRNNGCNVSVSTVIYPAGLWTSIGIPLSDFAVTNSCGLADVNAVSEGDIMGLPNRYSDLSAYQAALDGVNMKAARDSAMALILSSNVVRVRFVMPDNINITVKDPGTTYYGSDLSIKGAIKIQ